jgi:hypothetical protein
LAIVAYRCDAGRVREEPLIGSPQGAVISPLLAKLYLNVGPVLEQEVKVTSSAGAGSSWLRSRLMAGRGRPSGGRVRMPSGDASATRHGNPTAGCVRKRSDVP